jgi:lysophospholipase L1-like esterase
VETIAQVETAWPSTQVVVIGPSALFPLSETMSGSSNAIKAGADQAAVPFVDVVTLDWLTEENSPTYARADGSHLNTEGHQYFAEKLEGWLAATR